MSKLQNVVRTRPQPRDNVVQFAIRIGLPAFLVYGSFPFVVLFLGIIQIGPSIGIPGVLLWCWGTMETITALLFTAYPIPVSLLDNVRKPIVMPTD